MHACTQLNLSEAQNLARGKKDAQLPVECGDVAVNISVVAKRDHFACLVTQETMHASFLHFKHLGMCRVESEVKHSVPIYWFGKERHNKIGSRCTFRTPCRQRDIGIMLVQIDFCHGVMHV
jgi:hypothetical protein